MRNFNHQKVINMIIKIPVRYEGENGEKTLYTLFDSGSTFRASILILLKISVMHKSYIAL